MQAHYLEQTLLLDKVTKCFLCVYCFPLPKANEITVNYPQPLLLSLPLAVVQGH